MFQNILRFTLLVATIAAIGAANIPTGSNKLNSLVLQNLTVANGGDKLFITNNEADFENSRSDCRRNGGELYEILTEKDKTYLEKYFEEHATDANDFWVGGVCDVDMQKFVWLHGERINSNYWVANENDRCSYDNERVVGLYRGLSSGFKLTRGIRNTHRRAVCISY